MMNRLRTALVSVTAVAVAMMVLGSNARAQSVSSLENEGKSLMRLLSSLEKEKRQTLTLHNRELSVFSMIQVNTKALVAEQSALVAEQSALVAKQSALVAGQSALVAKQSALRAEQSALRAMEAKLPPFSKELKSIRGN